MLFYLMLLILLQVAALSSMSCAKELKKSNKTAKHIVPTEGNGA